MCSGEMEGGVCSGEMEGGVCSGEMEGVCVVVRWRVCVEMYM